MAPGEREREEGPAKRALHKVHTATLVINLARGWQQWAAENSTRQAQEPPGWVPGGAEHTAPAPKPATHPAALQDAQGVTKSLPRKPEGSESGHGSEEAPRIKRKEVTKSIVSKAYERGGDMGALSHRYEQEGAPSAPAAQPEDTLDRLLCSHESPTRRRKCAHLVSELSRGWKELGQEGPTWKSDSVDTEDSSYSEAEERPEQEVAQVAATRIKRPLASQ